jgi:FkbM family methyltransferase
MTPVEDQIMQTPQGWWVLRHDTHLSRWVEQAQRLDHDQWILQKLAPYIKPGTVVYDLGAALGDHTTFYLTKVGPQGAVVAIEPHPLQFECLKRNCPTAICIPHCVGEAQGEVWLFHEPDCIGSSRLIDPAMATTCAMTKHRRITIDEDCAIEGQVSFMKIDIEGCEPEALRGARHMIMQHRPAIWLEINPIALRAQHHSSAELQHLLEEELRYGVAEFCPPGAGWHGFGQSQCDALFLPL